MTREGLMGYIVGGVGGLVIAVGLITAECRTPDSVVDHEQRVVIHQADSTHRAAVVQLQQVRHHTDRTLADPRPAISKTEAHAIVHQERAAADTVFRADSAAIKARDTRIKTLERRTGGHLFLYGQAGLDLPPGLKVGDTQLQAEVGLSLKLSNTLSVQAAATTGGGVRIYGRKSLRLF